MDSDPKKKQVYENKFYQTFYTYTTLILDYHIDKATFSSHVCFYNTSFTPWLYYSYNMHTLMIYTLSTVLHVITSTDEL